MTSKEKCFWKEIHAYLLLISGWTTFSVWRIQPVRVGFWGWAKRVLGLADLWGLLSPVPLCCQGFLLCLFCCLGQFCGPLVKPFVLLNREEKNNSGKTGSRHRMAKQCRISEEQVPNSLPLKCCSDLVPVGFFFFLPRWCSFMWLKVVLLFNCCKTLVFLMEIHKKVEIRHAIELKEVSII